MCVCICINLKKFMARTRGCWYRGRGWVENNLFCLRTFCAICYVMGFRTHYHKIWYLGKLNILSWKGLRKQQKWEGHSDLLPIPYPSSLKWVMYLSCGIYPSFTIRNEGILITRNWEFRAEKEVQTNLVKLTLIFLIIPSPFTTPSPNSFVLLILHKCTVSLSKYYKSFLF